MNLGKTIILLLAALTVASAQTPEHRPFGVGERLQFDVNYGFITAGYAEMSIPSLDTVMETLTYKVLFTVRSTPTFDMFFEVRDRYETYLDTAAIVPWRFEQHIREGKYSRDYTALFDQRKNVATVGGASYPIPPGVHDIMSAFYFARTADYSRSKVGDRLKLQNFFKEKVNPLDVKFLGRQKVKVAAGTFNCIILEPMVKEGGLFKSEGRILIWLTDDENRIPVKVSTKVVIGSIDAELREYSGLRHTMNARVK